MSDEEKTSTPEKKTKRRGRKLFITLGVLLLLFVIGVSVLPVGLRYGAERWLRSMGQSNASIGNVDFNPFTGRLVIQTLGTAGEEGHELTLSHAILHLRWAELWNRRIFAEKFSLRDVALDVVRKDDGTIVIGGLPIVLSGEPPEGEPWGFGLGGVTLENVEIRYRDPLMDFNMHVQDGSLERIASWESEVNTPIAVTGIFDGGTVQLEGTIAPFRQAIRFDVVTQIEQLPLTFLESAVVDQGVSSLQGVFGTRLAIAGELNLSDESMSLNTKGNLSLSDIILTADATRIDQGGFTWEGEAEFSGAYADPAIRIAGVSAVNDLIMSVDSERIRLEHDFIQWDGTINLQSVDAKLINGVGALEMNGSQMLDRENEFFSLTLPGLSLRDVDVNYGFDSGTIEGDGNLVLTSPELVLDRADLGTISTDVDWGGTIRYWDGATLTELAGAIQFEDVQAEDVDDTTSRIRIAALTAGVETIETSKEEPAHTLDYSGVVTLANVEVTPIGTDYFIEQGQISWDGELQGDTDENNNMDVVFEANIEIQETTVSQIEKSRLLVAAQNFRLDSLNFAGPESIQAASLTMQNLRALERVLIEGGPKDAADRIARVESIDASGIRIDGESVALESLVVDTLTGWMERNANGEFEAATWFQATEVEPVEIEEIESGTEVESPETTKIRIGDFRLEGANSIVFRDQSVNPAVQLNMNDLSLAVADFDTGNTNQPMTVSASTKLGTYSLLKAEGTMSPLAEKISADMEAHIEQLELPPLTPYSERHVGYRLKSGVFNGDFIVKIDQGELDTQNELLVNALAMDRLKTDEKDEFAEQVGYPVNTALSLLRDKNGNIKLSIPVTGPMDDPDTGLGSVISKATFNAVKGGVLIVFKPLGAIFDRANTLKFEPVEFPVASAELPDDVSEKLKDVTKLLDKKPGIRLTLCGVTTTADEDFMIARKREELEAAALNAAAEIPEPSAPTEPEKPRNPFAPKEPATEEIQEAPAPAPEPELITLADEELLALSQARVEAVKNFLLQEGGIDSERLVLCTPGLDEEEGALPRVDFSL